MSSLSLGDIAYGIAVSLPMESRNDTDYHQYCHPWSHMIPIWKMTIEQAINQQLHVAAVISNFTLICGYIKLYPVYQHQIPWNYHKSPWNTSHPSMNTTMDPLGHGSISHSFELCPSWILRSFPGDHSWKEQPDNAKHIARLIDSMLHTLQRILEEMKLLNLALW